MPARGREPPRPLKTPLPPDDPNDRSGRARSKPAPHSVSSAALLHARLVHENDLHTRGRQRFAGTHADHHRSASTDAATVSTSTQNARDATPENPELRDKSPMTQAGLIERLPGTHR